MCVSVAWSMALPCPSGAPPTALKPNETMSPLTRIQPPPVTSPGVVAGSVQIFVALPHGSPASTCPFRFASAQPVIRSVPGNGGPAYVNVHCPWASVVQLPVADTEPSTVKKTVKDGDGVPPA